jgi:hypothetical protein
MKGLIFVSLLIQFSMLSAQREAYSWIYGNCDSEENNCQGVYGTAIIKFNDDSIESIRRVGFPVPFDFLSSCISDREGNFLMANSNHTIYDSLGNVLLDLETNDYINLQLGYQRHSAMFFKLNEETNDYYFVNFKVAWLDSTENPLLHHRIARIYCSKIRVDEDGYNVIKVDTLPRNDTILGSGIQACRHANGRDWWIFSSTWNQRQYLRGLLTPYGLNFEVYDGPGPNAFQNSGQNHFSADGTKLFHYITTSFRKMQIYDFDRCTGELSNFREIDFSSFIPFPPYDFTPYVLSPDASKIYMGRSNLSQTNYETIQIDVETGQLTVVADSVFVPLLTPNLKWVVSGYQDVFFTYIDDLSVITQPNNSGLNVDRSYINNCFEVNGAIEEPIEYANHLLGPIDGSSCDTLGLDDETSIKKVEHFSFNVFPNPGNEEIHFITDLPLPLKITIRDNQGKIVIEKLVNQKSFSIHEGIAKLNSGIYFVELKSERNTERLIKKWMKIDKE